MAELPPIVLTIAGSDPSGGAGLQADLRTIAAHGLYGAGVPTALTVQNTTGVASVTVLEPALVERQLRAVLDDLAVTVIKVGMLGTAEVARAVLEALPDVPAVLDPVIRSSSGAALLAEDGVEVLREHAARLALITPNLAEASALLGRAVLDARGAAEELHVRLGCPVLVTGGHGADPTRCVDWLADGAVHGFAGPRIDTEHDHGTGCLLSTSIACALAAGRGLHAAVEHGRACVARGLRDSLAIGAGTGPVFLVRPPE